MPFEPGLTPCHAADVCGLGDGQADHRADSLAHVDALDELRRMIEAHGRAVLDKSELRAVDAIYGDVPAVRIIWAGSGGPLPWEPGYANPHDSRRLLGPVD